MKIWKSCVSEHTVYLEGSYTVKNLIKPHKRVIEKDIRKPLIPDLYTHKTKSNQDIALKSMNRGICSGHIHRLFTFVRFFTHENIFTLNCSKLCAPFFSMILTQSNQTKIWEKINRSSPPNRTEISATWIFYCFPPWGGERCFPLQF